MEHLRDPDVRAASPNLRVSGHDRDVVVHPSPWALVRRSTRPRRAARRGSVPFFTGRVDGVAVREVAAVDDQCLGAVQAIHRARVARKCCWSVALLLARA